MSNEIPPLQTRALDAVRTGDDNAQNELINSILNDGVTAAEYNSMQNTVAGLKAEAERIVSRIDRHSERANTLESSDRHAQARNLRAEIRNDTKLLNDFQTFTRKLTGNVSIGRLMTKVGDAADATTRTFADAMAAGAEWLASKGNISVRTLPTTDTNE